MYEHTGLPPGFTNIPESGCRKIYITYHLIRGYVKFAGKTLKMIDNNLPSYVSKSLLDVIR